MSNQEAHILRCWRCRKYIANSVCLAKCNRKEPSETSQPAAAGQESCNMWHVNLEVIPEWVKCVIEKAQWTIGRLHCPFCEACLGGFNFVCNTKCSCGELVNIHFCKSQTDCQPAFSVKLAKLSGKQLPLLKIQSDLIKDTCHEVVTATLEIKNQGLSYMARNNNGTGRLTEALCLEVRAPRFEPKSKKLPLKALNQKRNHSASYPRTDACSVKPFRRRSRSLDLNIRARLVLSPALYETCSMGTIYRIQNENPPVYKRSGLQLESSRKVGNSFQDLYSSRIEMMKNPSKMDSSTMLKRHFDCCTYNSESALATAELMSNKPVLESKLNSAGVAEFLCCPLQHHRAISMNTLSATYKLIPWFVPSRRSMVQDHLRAFTAHGNLHTDDEHELRGDKESYLCAVCLDVYFNPYMCYPCHHIFCEPCLRMLAKDNPASTPCPLCRTTIARVFFQTELNNSTKSFFPTEYLKLKENFQKSNSAQCPLPSCKKAFRVFEG
ncbi:RN180 ligase, partial [Nyctiprogne leucopyga]|nr:RN180 ligase [Nyctiprogne leucopyga]